MCELLSWYYSELSRSTNWGATVFGILCTIPTEMNGKGKLPGRLLSCVQINAFLVDDPKLTASGVFLHVNKLDPAGVPGNPQSWMLLFCGRLPEAPYWTTPGFAPGPGLSKQMGHEHGLLTWLVKCVQLSGLQVIWVCPSSLFLYVSTIELFFFLCKNDDDNKIPLGLLCCTYSVVLKEEWWPMV